MQKSLNTARCATAAIAAVLAIGSTPLLAQDVTAAPTPTIVQPAPAPTVVAPAAPAASTATPAPVMQSVPQVQPLPQVVVPNIPRAEPQAEAPAAATRAARAETPRAERAAPAPTSAAPASAPVTDPSAPLTTTPEVTESIGSLVLAPIPVEEPAASAAVVEEANQGPAAGVGILAALIALLLIPAAVFFTLRSRRAAKREEVPQVERPVVARAEPVPVIKPAPVAAYAAEADRSAHKPVFAFNSAPVAASATQRNATQTTKGSLPADGASVALPARMPESFEERDALLKQMAAAKPDRANPFTNYKARLKRARLILQSLGRKFTKGSWIDLSQYPNNWPELARNRTLQAA